MSMCKYPSTQYNHMYMRVYIHCMYMLLPIGSVSIRLMDSCIHTARARPAGVVGVMSPYPTL